MEYYMFSAASASGGCIPRASPRIHIPFTTDGQDGCRSKRVQGGFAMKQRIALFWGALTLLLIGVVAAIAYHAGQTTTVIATRAGDGTVYYPGYGWGFFPFFGLFPLLLIGILLFAVFRRPWGRGYW